MLKLSLFLAIAATTADAFAPSSGLGLRASKAPLAASSRTGISSRHASSASGITMAAVPLSTIELKNKAGHSTTIYPFGACVTSYKAPHEVLFVRPDAKMDGSKPISGGVPHCFPQFGPGKIQQHGFARNLIWDVRSKSDEEGQATLVLTNNDETMAMWPNKFEATYKVILEEDRLDLELNIKNTDDKAWDFQAALHTYFHVTDIDKCEVTGAFEGQTYLDKMEDPPKEKKESRKAIVFDKEVDSVYSGVSGEVCLVNKAVPDQSTTIRNLKGWADTVLWSPYGNDGMGYKNFACVESAKVTPAMLQPGETWTGMTSIYPKKL